MADYRVERVLDIKALLGEGPAWSVEHQALFWVDIHLLTINKFDPASGKNSAWTLPAMPGCFAMRDGNAAVIAARDGFYDIDFGTGAIKLRTKAPFSTDTHRFNDGKTDRQGRFWVGSFAMEYLKTRVENEGIFYRYDGASLEPGIVPITVPNGSAFSPDGRKMYRAESIQGTVYVYDYDPATGKASNQRVFTQIPKELGIPDGATVDTEGGYWAALPLGPKGGGIGRFKPDGTFDFRIEVPVLLPTMVAFGGPDMSTIYITSAREGPEGQVPLGENAGDLFAVKTPFKGIPETNFMAKVK